MHGSVNNFAKISVPQNLEQNLEHSRKAVLVGHSVNMNEETLFGNVAKIEDNDPAPAMVSPRKAGIPKEDAEQEHISAGNVVMSSQSGNSTIAEGESLHSEDENDVRKDMALRQEPRVVEAQGSNGSEGQNDQPDDFIVVQKRKRHKRKIKKMNLVEQPDNKYSHLKYNSWSDH